MSRADRFAIPVVLITLWIAWPVLEVVGNGPIFFLARGAHPLDILLVGSLIAVALPVAVGAASALLPLVASKLVFTLATVLCSMALCAQVMRAVGAGSVLVWVVASILTNLVIDLLVRKSGAMRQMIRYLAVSPSLILALFLFASPARAIVFASEPSLPAPSLALDPTPVILVVFDELPTASLITPEGAINSDWYPGFARLQTEATWFRNAATVHQQTDQAVPAILTGMTPTMDDLPIVSHHPQNIFTLLGPDYSLLAHEPVTNLCPRDRCSAAPSQATAGDRFSALATDLGHVGAHTFLPNQLTHRLPRIDQQWANFGKIAQRDATHSPGEEVDAFVTAAQQFSEGTPFLFLHAMLPHRPWVYLPDGVYYGGITSPSSVGMGIDTGWQTKQAQQRHLLQVQYADRLLSRLIGTLASMGIYDEALVIVTADHGVSFTDKGADRAVSDESIEEIGSVPLFIKYPKGLDAGVVDDYRALTIDVVPTIADVIGLEVPAPFDGVSLASGERPAREPTVALGESGPIEWTADGTGKYDAAGRLEAMFPEGDLFALSLDDSAGLVGTEAGALAEFQLASGWWLLDAAKFDHVGEPGALPPAIVEGRSAAAIPDQTVAVVVNGVVRAVTRTYPAGPDGSAFDVIVDPAVFRDGKNAVDIYLRPRT